MEKYYKILGLKLNASKEDIDKRYQHLMDEFNPDNHDDDSLKKLFKSEQQRVFMAYQKITTNLNTKIDIVSELKNPNTSKEIFNKLKQYKEIFLFFIIIIILFFIFKSNLNTEENEVSDISSSIYNLNNSIDLTKGKWTIIVKWETQEEETAYENQQFLLDSTISESFSTFKWSMRNDIFRLKTEGVLYLGTYKNGEIVGTMTNDSDNSGTFLIKQYNLNKSQINNVPPSISGCTDLLACNYGDYEESDNNSCVYNSSEYYNILTNGLWTIIYKWETQEEETAYENQQFLLDSTISESFSTFKWSMRNDIFRLKTEGVLYLGTYKNGEIVGTMTNDSDNSGTFLIKQYNLNKSQINNVPPSISGCTDLLACNYGDYEESDNNSCVYNSNEYYNILTNGLWTISFKWETQKNESVYEDQKFSINLNNPGEIDDFDYEWSMCGNTFKMTTPITKNATYQGYFSNGRITGTMINVDDNRGTFTIEPSK